jgi:cold shock protein
MTNGTVKFFNEQKGFGFIAPDDGGGDTYVHASAVERSDLGTLQQDQRVSYDIVLGQRGKSEAANLRAVEDGGAQAAVPPAGAAD